jgi:hypothetical protein
LQRDEAQQVEAGDDDRPVAATTGTDLRLFRSIIRAAAAAWCS